METRDNMGAVDRVVRAVAGVALVLGALAAGEPVARAIMGLLAVIMLGTASAGFCPLYRALGMSTRGAPRR